MKTTPGSNALIGGLLSKWAGRSTVLMAVPEKAASPMKTVESGIVIDSSFKHCPKAWAPMEETDAGKTKDSSSGEE